MKVFKWIFKTMTDIFKGCFYLFSAYTLVMLGVFLLTLLFGVFDIHGLKEKVIIYAYLFVVGVYAIGKGVLWIINMYKKFCALYRQFFGKEKKLNT